MCRGLEFTATSKPDTHQAKELRVETKTSTQADAQTEDLRIVQYHSGFCTPCCKKVCAALCVLFCLLVAIVVAIAAPYAIRFEHGMEYMAEMKKHTKQALSLNGHDLFWYHLDDPVMGGHSESAVEVTSAGLRFYGNISTRDGGFASCATVPQELGLSKSMAGFNVTLSGNGELFKLTATTSDSVWDPIWQADLPAPSLERGRHTLLLPLSAFSANRMGSPVKAAALDPAAIQSVGLNLALVNTCAALLERSHLPPSHLTHAHAHAPPPPRTGTATRTLISPTVRLS